MAALLAQVPERIPASDVGVIVAHPDDETIGCGSRMAHWDGFTLVMVTDGAPRDLADAHACGFSTVAEYSAARRKELLNALAAAAVPTRALVCCDIPDQQAAHRLVPATRTVLEIIRERRLRTLFTHAYEGGHPDHDAVAFAVNVAARLAGKGAGSPSVIEMPFYRQGPDGKVLLQDFAPLPSAHEVDVTLSARDIAVKQAMMDAHQTQAGVLAPFPIDRERFRLAPHPDFLTLPNTGRLHYETQCWGLTGAEWLLLARAALDALGAEGSAG